MINAYKDLIWTYVDIGAINLAYNHPIAWIVCFRCQSRKCSSGCWIENVIYLYCIEHVDHNVSNTWTTGICCAWWQILSLPLILSRFCNWGIICYFLKCLNLFRQFVDICREKKLLLRASFKFRKVGYAERSRGIIDVHRRYTSSLFKNETWGC